MAGPGPAGIALGTDVHVNMSAAVRDHLQGPHSVKRVGQDHCVKVNPQLAHIAAAPKQHPQPK